MTNYERNRLVTYLVTNQTITSSIERRVFVRRHHNEKFHSRLLALRLKGGGGLVGIWSFITYEARGLHFLFERININV